MSNARQHCCRNCGIDMREYPDKEQPYCTRCKAWIAAPDRPSLDEDEVYLRRRNALKVVRDE